ncbi:methyltransferase [Fulvivirgaceae bacterium PWU5]|uniref:Methyltransferase n=1 Tax=Dawidia cretensis TaxID=2782350 RepID=A0AAP2E5B2_9BACT|nr:class I SAM-dependent methyltransferase [Dawidia cretensis]MBT1712129.1 methyltransferase [Dawidia cretensis]
MSAEFDQYAKSYQELHASNIKASGYDPSYFDQQKIRELHRVAGKEYSGNINFLDFGCGIGKSEPHIRKYFPEAVIHGADPSQESLKQAAEKNKSVNVTYHYFAETAQFNPGISFDIIFVANVFHHIPATEHVATLAKLKSLLSPRGKLFVFEHNPWNPLTSHAFNTCEFDQGCVMIPAPAFRKKALAGGFAKIKTNFILFFPKALQAFVPLEKFLTKVPIGAQYYVICS